MGRNTDDKNKVRRRKVTSSSESSSKNDYKKVSTKSKVHKNREEIMKNISFLLFFLIIIAASCAIIVTITKGQILDLNIIMSILNVTEKIVFILDSKLTLILALFVIAILFFNIYNLMECDDIEEHLILLFISILISLVISRGCYIFSNWYYYSGNILQLLNIFDKGYDINILLIGFSIVNLIFVFLHDSFEFEMMFYMLISLSLSMFIVARVSYIVNNWDYYSDSVLQILNLFDKGYDIDTTIKIYIVMYIIYILFIILCSLIYLLKTKTEIMGGIVVVVAVVGFIAFALIKFDILSGIFLDKEEKAEDIVVAMSEGNIDEINNIIFKESTLIIDEDIKDMFENENKNTQDQDIISQILLRDSIKLNKVNKDTIEYEVTAPDLTNIFEDIDNKYMSDDDFSNYITNYIEQAEMTNITVSVPYSIENKEMNIDYKDKEFINAITGGLLKAYHQLYQKMIEEYNAKE